MTVTATATLTSTGSLLAPKKGDVLTYTVTITGNTRTEGVDAGIVKANGQPVPPTGGPWTWVIHDPEEIGPPVVTGFTPTKPFTQQPDPHVWVATY